MLIYATYMISCSTDTCLGPQLALRNLAEPNSSSFVGWNPQGGGEDNEMQVVVLAAPGLANQARRVKVRPDAQSCFVNVKRHDGI